MPDGSGGLDFSCKARGFCFVLAFAVLLTVVAVVVVLVPLLAVTKLSDGGILASWTLFGNWKLEIGNYKNKVEIILKFVTVEFGNCGQ